MTLQKSLVRMTSKGILLLLLCVESFFLILFYKLDNELKKLEDTKRKSGADLRRKNEVSREIEDLERNIQAQRLVFRQLTTMQ